MKIKCTLMTMLMIWGALMINACEDSGSTDKTKQLLMLCGAGYAIGNTGPSGSGVVFYTTDCGLHGLEATTVDQSAAATWITGGSTQITLNGYTSKAIGTGLANTNAIKNQTGHVSSAANLCLACNFGGKTDWFLPSQDELSLLYAQKDKVGGFANDIYWNSSEHKNTTGCAKDFSTGNNVLEAKGNTNYVRCVRAF
jgi:hypothetical protein